MSPLLAILDLAALLTVWLLAGSASWSGFAYLLLALASLTLGGEHRSRLTHRVSRDAFRLVHRLAAPLFVLAAVNLVVPVDLTILLQASVSALVVLIVRAFAYAAIREARCRGRVVERAIIFGAGTVGCELVRLLREHREYGLAPAGVVDDVAESSGVALLGGLADLAQVVERTGARHVIVAFSPTRERDLIPMVRSAAQMDITLHVVPRFFEVGMAPSGADVDLVEGIPLYRVRRSALRSPDWRLKRAIDVTVSLAVLVVAAPLMAALAVAVRHTSPGPAIFRQRRIGQRNREFELLKFRTLPADYVDRQLNADPEDYQCSFGRLLRRTSLDELPQIVNVLRGDMTLVGPRPERGYLVDQFSGEVHGYADRHRLPMGLTGLAQVEGMRGNDSIEDRARFDNYYIENWSSWQDMVILLRTPGAVLRSIREPMHPATGQVLLASDGEIEGVAGVRPVSPSS